MITETLTVASSSVSTRSNARWQSVLSRDYPVVLGLSLIGGVVTLAATLAADVAAALVDPRLRESA